MLPHMYTMFYQSPLCVLIQTFCVIIQIFPGEASWESVDGAEVVRRQEHFRLSVRELMPQAEG